MKITVKDGLNVISIGLGYAESYLRIKKSMSLVWPDHAGSVGQYMSLLPLDENERQILYDTITDNLSSNFSYKEELLYDILKPLFSLLSNGDYWLSYHEGHVMEYPTINGVEYEPLWSVYFPEPVKLEDISKIKAEHVLKQQYILSNQYAPDLIDFTTRRIYQWQNDFYVATRPYDEIDIERIKYYEERILKGERPFAIVLSAVYGDTYSEDFVLDGHHKLMAYNNLGLNPPTVRITRIYKTTEEIEFDLDKIKDSVYPWQFEHLIKHNEPFENVIDNRLAYYEKQIRNGEYKEFFDNRQLKFKATYKNGIPNGPMREWYPNGRLKSKYHYRDGVKVKLWRQWYDSGRLKLLFRFNDNGQYNGPKVKYSEKGTIILNEYWINGIHANGRVFKASENHSSYEETYYVDGKKIEFKSFLSGRLNYHSKYSIEKNKFIEIPVPEPKKPIYTPSNNQHIKDQQAEKYKKEGQRIQIGCVGLIIVFLIGFLVFIRSLAPDGKKHLPRRNSYYNLDERDRGVLERRNFYEEEQEINLLNFEEARQNPLNDPVKSRNIDSFVPHKFVKPFLAQVFQKRNEDIFKTDTNLIIYNKTDKEMVLIAWFRKRFRKDLGYYIPNNSIPRSLVYALYIPKKDSIKLDFQMYRFIFYAGNNLKRFNSYPYHNYDDSLDYKFSQTSLVDSVLLKTSFRINDNSELKAKKQQLYIEQPNQDNYELTWDAKMRLYAMEKSQTENGKAVVKEMISPGAKYFVHLGKKSPVKQTVSPFPINIVESEFNKVWIQDKILNPFLAKILKLNEMNSRGELFYRRSIKNDQILIKVVPKGAENFYYLIDNADTTVRRVFSKSIESD